MKHTQFIALLFLILISCKKERKKETENFDKIYRLEQMGWKSKSVNRYFNHINYTVTEVPLYYYIMKSEGSDDLSRVDSIYKSMERERVLEIEFHHDEEKDLLQPEFTKRSYEEGVKYLAFAIQQDFKLVTGSGDTIACAGVQFERNYKVAPFKRAMLYFGGIPPNDQIQLLYNDQLFGSGMIKFKFKENPIKL